MGWVLVDEVSPNLVERAVMDAGRQNAMAIESRNTASRTDDMRCALKIYKLISLYA